MKFLPLIILLILSFPAFPAGAGTPPVPPSKKERLGNLDKKLEDKKKQKQRLEQKVKTIEKQLENTRDNLIKLSKDIQKNEAILQNLEDKITKLEDQKTKIQISLKDDRKSIARLVLALERLRRVPPEALILKPDSPYKTAQSAMLMRDIVPVLHKQAKALHLKLDELDLITQDLTGKKAKSLEASSSLKSSHKKLSNLMKKRESLYGSTRGDLKTQEEQIRKIAQQSKNLQDLVRRLEKKQKEEEQRTANLKRRKPTQKRYALNKSIVQKMPEAGRARLPISGIIRTRYNEPDHLGAPSKGFSIEGRGGALVIAPMGGTVRFAGYFKNYGNMVILEHKKGYHSLIAGLEKIDTVVGQNVSLGEPLGLLHHAASGSKPALYYELRLNGMPIDPATKFIDLG